MNLYHYKYQDQFNKHINLLWTKDTNEYYNKCKEAGTTLHWLRWWTYSTVWTAAASNGQVLAEIETPALLMSGRDPIIPLNLMVGDLIQEVPPIKLDALSKLRERSNDRSIGSTVRRMNSTIEQKKEFLSTMIKIGTTSKRKFYKWLWIILWINMNYIIL